MKRYNSAINVIIAICVAMMSLFNMISPVFAAGGLTIASVTLSDPRPNAPSGAVTYSVSWQAATTATLKCFTYTVSTSPDSGQGSTPTGFSNASGANGTFTGLTAANWTIDNSTNGIIKETYVTGQSVSSGSQITTPITSLTNPTTSGGGGWFIEIKTFSDACTTLVDTTIIGFFTVPSVLVSATIDPTLTFNVAGVAASTTYKGALSTSSICADSATAVTYGSQTNPLSADTNYDCAQTLTTTTNSNNGYQVTIQGKQASGDFMKLLSDNTKSITNWTGTNATPTASPTSGSFSVFGYTTSDAGLSGTATRFTASDNLFAGLTTTADQVSYNAGPIAAKAINVGLRLRYPGTQQAGTYQGTLVYTCTPVF
ncbi:MAG: hypothetical protein ACHQUB_01845 [Candidatus Saccharimonadia bacterium]